MSELEVYAYGPVHCSVCTNIEDMDEIVRRVNEVNLAGTTHGWKISEDKEFASGSPNPNPCEQKDGYKHYLMVC